MGEARAAQPAMLERRPGADASGMVEASAPPFVHRRAQELGTDERIVSLHLGGTGLAGRHSSDAAGAGAIPRLSARSLQVLELVADGASNADIARRLFVAPDTVKKHVRKLCRAMGARNRAHAVAIGFRSGLLGADADERRRQFARG